MNRDNGYMYPCLRDRQLGERPKQTGSQRQRPTNSLTYRDKDSIYDKMGQDKNVYVSLLEKLTATQRQTERYRHNNEKRCMDIWRMDMDYGYVTSLETDRDPAKEKDRQTETGGHEQRE